MTKGTRVPVPYADVEVGHWYQSRFEFTDDQKIDPPANTIAEQSTSPVRATPRNKSHRVFVLRKVPTPGGPVEGKAICLFLTSFGGHLDWSNSTADCLDRLKYIAVNETVAPMSPYINIPITVRALYGFIKFTDTYDLPIGAGGDQAIVHMREAGKGKTSISSPEWVLDYIRRLKISWVTWILTNPEVEEKWPETQARWLESAEAIAAEFGRPAVAVASSGRKDGTKRLREENDKDEVGKGKAPAKRRSSGSRWFDGADDDDDDDDYVDSPMWSGDNESVAHADELEKFNDSGIQDMDGGGDCDAAGAKEVEGAEVLPELIRAKALAVPAAQQFTARPVLVSVELYELDGEEDDDIDEDVNFSLLDALFRLPPLW